MRSKQTGQKFNKCQKCFSPFLECCNCVNIRTNFYSHCRTVRAGKWYKFFCSVIAVLFLTPPSSVNAITRHILQQCTSNITRTNCYNRITRLNYYSHNVKLWLYSLWNLCTNLLQGFRILCNGHSWPFPAKLACKLEYCVKLWYGYPCHTSCIFVRCTSAIRATTEKS